VFEFYFYSFFESRHSWNAAQLGVTFFNDNYAIHW